MFDLGRLGSFLLGLGLAWAAVGIAFGLPRLVRSLHAWTTSALYGASPLWAGRLATWASTIAVFWTLIVIGAIYSPLAALAPELLPFPGSISRRFATVDFWVVALVLPPAFGLAQGIVSGHRRTALLRDSLTGHVYLSAIVVALAVLLPWVMWRRARILFTRRKRVTFRVEIEIASYVSAAHELCECFNSAGLTARLVPAPLAIHAARRFVDTLGPPALRSKSAYSVIAIEADGARLILYEHLLDLVAREDVHGRAYAALLGNLPPRGMWWTHSKEARELEEAILGRNGAKQIDDLGQRLALIDAAGDEWRALYREYLQSREVSGAYRAMADSA